MTKQRSTIEYDLRTLSKIQKQSQKIKLDIEIASLADNKEDIIILFENQESCGRAVRNIFNNKCIINCLVYGITQSGKTGAMTALILYYVLSNNIPTENIYIISGLSDVEWKKDTKKRMPGDINSRVFHRKNFNKFKYDIQGKRNCLIIIDEIQIACKESQTIHKTFKECKFYDLDFLLENDIKFIQFSATPDGNIEDINMWKDYSAKVKLSPGDGHYGPKQAIEQGRLKQFKDLTNIDNVKEFKKDIDEKNYPNCRYYIIRVPNKKEKDKTTNQAIVISNIKKIFGENYNYNEQFLEKDKEDINYILKEKPAKNTCVFICETYRCAKTMDKKHIGVFYERFCENIDDSTIIQGLFGRSTGYDDNGDSICYTNIDSVKNYIKLWDNDMEFTKGIEWNTKTTKHNKKEDITEISNTTYNSVENIPQLRDNDSKRIKENVEKPLIEIFNSLDEVNSFCKENNLGRGPNKRIPNSSGFYECMTQIDKETIVRSKEFFEDIKENNNWGFIKKDDKKNLHRCYPCYSDTNDPKTLEWWLIYYK